VGFGGLSLGRVGVCRSILKVEGRASEIIPWMLTPWEGVTEYFFLAIENDYHFRTNFHQTGYADLGIYALP